MTRLAFALVAALFAGWYIATLAEGAAKARLCPEVGVCFLKWEE